ncbi:unnamed protein product [Pseudo-nitzschia multistriata]|uniref:TsaA-like domain-containing protein n=1 Tax=Pseudo-nitzschia multistriata TaxID=183589 RepID=A0A448Z2L0_9STRA|nr:unnamed protein product [Pseudo-nitzschia multistriata]
MFATNNAVALAAGISTIAVTISIFSWMEMQRIQNELDLLKEKRNTVDKQNQDSRENKIHDSNGARGKNGESISYGQESKTGEKSHKPNERQTQQPEEDQNDLSVMRIGVIRSIYRLCVGTPRQGLLAPDARGRIELDKIGNSSTAATVSGLEEFSYIWVLFHFHLNTQSAKKARRFKSKISPPAMGGKKVGIYATRSPHRHNPIGITLCKLDRIQEYGPHKVTLHVSGLDLVDGTPVLDIKPYVPVYDSVNAVAQATLSPSPPEVQIESSISSSQTPNGSSSMSPAFGDLPLPPPRVPEWVQGGLATKRNVVITKTAKNELEEILQHNPKALDFYGSHCYCDSDGKGDSTAATMLRVIEQVLSIDVRSSHQTRKARTGRSQAERAARVRSTFDVESTVASNNDSAETKRDEMEQITTQDAVEELQERKMCTQQLDNLLIYFTIQEVAVKRDSSHGSG